MQTRDTVVPMVTNSEQRTKLPPSDEQFPYYLEVNDQTDTEQYSSTQAYPRHGWCCLWQHDPAEPVSDVNPYPQLYIQEQTYSRDEWHNNPTPPIDINSDHVLSNNRITYPWRVEDELTPSETDERLGWDQGPTVLWDFIETLRDEYYEHGVDPVTLPVRVHTTRKEAYNDHDPFDEYTEIYFRDNNNTVEYVMWNSNELFMPSDYANNVPHIDSTPPHISKPPNSELIQKVLTAVANAYEDPRDFLDRWGGRAHPI